MLAKCVRGISDVREGEMRAGAVSVYILVNVTQYY